MLENLNQIRLTSTLTNHCFTATKVSCAVTSYITTTPSAFRKNCFVMLRYLEVSDFTEREHKGAIKPSHLPCSVQTQFNLKHSRAVVV